MVTLEELESYGEMLRREADDQGDLFGRSRSCVELEKLLSLMEDCRACRRLVSKLRTEQEAEAFQKEQLRRVLSSDSMGGKLPGNTL